MNGIADRRIVQRYQMELPCLIQANREGAAPVLGRTKDVSSSGAYLTINAQIQAGLWIELDFLIQSECDAAPKSHFRTSGVVVRQDEDGVAVRFNGAYHITPVQSVVRQLRRRLEWLEQMGEGLASAETLLKVVA